MKDSSAQPLAQAPSRAQRSRPFDGAAGEGGGQVLRNALALSLATGRSFTIDNIRAGRGKPGLLRQHLACVRAATEIGARARSKATRSAQRSVRFAPRACIRATTTSPSDRREARCSCSRRFWRHC